MTSCTSRDVMGKYCSVSSSTFTLIQQWLLSARGEPSAVRETTVASVWRAISAASTKTFVRPVCEMKKQITHTCRCGKHALHQRIFVCEDGYVESKKLVFRISCYGSRGAQAKEIDVRACAICQRLRNCFERSSSLAVRSALIALSNSLTGTC